MKNISMVSFKELLSRGIDSIYPSAEGFERKLATGEKLRIYLGIDPTSPEIHLGHAVSLRKLRALQDLGHKITLVFGDFTGMIGDPSGRDTQRRPLSREQVLKNSADYKAQVAKILDFKKNPPEIAYNASWWDKIGTRQFLEIVSHFTVGQLLERDLFQARIKKGLPIAASEFLYPALQGFDSVALDTDAEIGGTDQTFNMLVGRQLLKNYKSKEKFVVTTKLLAGTDGRKMSKSYGNTVSISAQPEQMYGKLMSIADSLIIEYLDLTTDVSRQEIEDLNNGMASGQINPMEAKKRLAFEVVKLYDGETAAKKAQAEFERVFQRGELPETKKVAFKTGEITAINLVVNLKMANSRSSARRLIEQGAVKINREKITDPNQLIKIEVGTIAQIGKLKAVEVISKKD